MGAQIDMKKIIFLAWILLCFNYSNVNAVYFDTTVGPEVVTLSSGCGSTATVSGGDSGGAVTINGAGITASCQVTFYWIHSNAPICIGGIDNTTDNIGVVATTTTVTITTDQASFTAGDVVSYHCDFYL